MSGLAQLQSACGICCSAPFWPPEFERSGTLYRAFMDGPITEPEVMKKHFANAAGEMHTERRGDKISAAGWQLAVHAIWCVDSGEDPGSAHVEPGPDPPPWGRFIERGHHEWVQSMIFHFRPDKAAKPDQARANLM